VSCGRGWRAEPPPPRGCGRRGGASRPETRSITASCQGVSTDAARPGAAPCPGGGTPRRTRRGGLPWRGTRRQGLAWQLSWAGGGVRSVAQTAARPPGRATLGSRCGRGTSGCEIRFLVAVVIWRVELSWGDALGRQPPPGRRPHYPAGPVPPAPGPRLTPPPCGRGKASSAIMECAIVMWSFRKTKHIKD